MVGPANSFRFSQIGWTGTDEFFVFGPLSAGCILDRVEMAVMTTTAQQWNFGFALSGSDTADAAAYSAGYLPHQGSGVGTLVGGRASMHVALPVSGAQRFAIPFGITVTEGAAFLIFGVQATDPNVGSMQLGVFVVSPFKVVGGAGGVSSPRAVPVG